MSRHIISPLHSSFSLLGRVTSFLPIRHSTPADFLSIEEIISELHQDYSSQAKNFFLSPRLASSQRLWTSFLQGGWSRLPFMLRLEICLKIFWPL
jgi:hypothetical protein